MIFNLNKSIDLNYFYYYFKFIWKYKMMKKIFKLKDLIYLNVIQNINNL